MERYRGWTICKTQSGFYASADYADDLEFEGEAMKEVYAYIDDIEDANDLEQEELEREWAEERAHELMERYHLR